MRQEEVDLKKLIQSMIRSYRTTTADKNQEIIFVDEFENEPLIIESDRLYLNRIFDNLLSNAVKFSPEGKQIKVVLVRKSDGLVVRIEDEGPGISEEDQEKLFQKFQVLSARPTAGETSTGLGLSITKSLVKMLEGSVKYELNPVGRGSVFIIELPVLIHA